MACWKSFLVAIAMFWSRPQQLSPAGVCLCLRHRHREQPAVARYDYVNRIRRTDVVLRPVRLPFVASKTVRDDVTAVLQSIRETLNLDLDQYRGRKPGKLVPSGFAYLRAQAERVGIYVLLIGNLGSHHTSLDVETFRGFALADDLAPFIVINDQDAEGAVRATADGKWPSGFGPRRSPRPGRWSKLICAPAASISPARPHCASIRL